MEGSRRIIEQQAVDNAIEFVRASGLGEWNNIRWERQDGGEFLLLSVDISAVDDFEIPDPQRLWIIEGLNEIIDTAGRNDGPTWMVVFVHASEVVDSLYNDWM